MYKQDIISNQTKFHLFRLITKVYFATDKSQIPEGFFKIIDSFSTGFLMTFQAIWPNLLNCHMFCFCAIKYLKSYTRCLCICYILWCSTPAYLSAKDDIHQINSVVPWCKITIYTGGFCIAGLNYISSMRPLLPFAGKYQILATTKQWRHSNWTIHIRDIIICCL